MRLTCPRCGAQYEIDGAAIPASGRAVECSACGHVWHHTPDAADGHAAQAGQAAPDAFDAGERPKLHRPLDESVLSVLREEAAREIEARRRDATSDDGDDPDYSPPPLPPPGTDPATDAATGVGTPDSSAEDHPWPAATLTHPAPPASANILARRLEAELDSEPPREETQSVQAPPQPPSPTPAVPDAERPTVAEFEQPPADTITTPADPLSIGRSDSPVTASSTRPPTAHAPAPPQGELTYDPPPRSGRRGGYAIGFGLAIMVALILLALYALAPRVADQGALGARLMDYRAEADRGRVWLQDRAEALVSAIRE